MPDRRAPASLPPSGPRTVTTAAAIVVGNELLTGKVRDENLYELARTLRVLGIELKRVVMVGDDRAAIATEINAARASAEVVFTSGGVGPTHDDVTVAGAAEAFGVEVTESVAMVRMLREHYGAGCRDEHLRMARVPVGAWLAHAPGMRWPAIVIDTVWLLPGVPEVFRAKLAVVRAWLRGPAPFHSRAVYATTDESDLVGALDALAAAHPAVDVGSYPRWEATDHRTKITLDGRDPAAVEAAVTDLLSRLPPSALVRTE